MSNVVATTFVSDASEPFGSVDELLRSPRDVLDLGRCCSIAEGP